MKKTSGLKILASYLFERSGVIFLCLLTAGLFLLIGALSHLDMEPLLYALMLSSLCLTVAFIISYSRYCNHFREVENGQNHPETLPKGLPAPQSRLENLYQTMLEDQRKMRLEEKNLQTRKMKEREDYYTLWMHQIKTPIAAMRLLLQSSETQPNVQFEQELFKTERYAEMALTYLRLESETDDMALQRQDLYSLVKKAVKKYSLMFIHKRIALELEPFHVQVLTDEKWFLVLLEQILSNAVKYTDQGCVRIGIQDGSVLTVRDSGAGIPAEDLPMVFERGFTGHNGRVDGRATGIGLYLAKEVAGRLGHKLSLQSTPGQGTTVLIDVSDIPLEIYE